MNFFEGHMIQNVCQIPLAAAKFQWKLPVTQSFFYYFNYFF